MHLTSVCGLLSLDGNFSPAFQLLLSFEELLSMSERSLQTIRQYLLEMRGI